ncbi:hypothetical protein OKW22_001323, partial [Bacilli bacterium PM5-3]|nr:hypothetical protein [Bacilli bacterium PM5-3]
TQKHKIIQKYINIKEKVTQFLGELVTLSTV